MFQPVAASASFPGLELEVLQFWKDRSIYEQSLAQRSDAPRFVFYEGPPTANGMPHPGHCLTRAIKDLFPRYKTMRGYLCERKAGWDTHGLPVEVEVSKELGIHAKEEIEKYGVEPFIHKCQESVWRYMKQWEQLTERLGFWIKLDEAYVTYHQSYVESVWWSLKSLFDRGLLYQGHKIVWWWAQGGTALSSGEVGQGYRQVADPSVYVKLPLVEEVAGDRGQESGEKGPGNGDQGTGNSKPTSLLVWTTTPWTLPSNQFAAVHPELDYATVMDSETGERLIMAAALVETIAAKVKRELTVESTCKGSELLDMKFVPPYDCFYRQFDAVTGNVKFGSMFRKREWVIVEADFVTIDSGTGIVHIAPAFGEADYEVLMKVQSGHNSVDIGPELINAVGADGKFTDEAPEFVRGRWVKDCDKDITRDLKQRGLLYHQEQYLHDYPFCWRAEQDPLIQYPRKSWFIKTTAFKDQMLANNEQINWLPEHIKHGRFGNFLETNVDWALSRERFWGTPLPIWLCEQTGQAEAIGNYADLLAKPGVQGTEVWAAAKAKQPNLVDDLKVHKPYIDAITYASPFADGARMRRVSEVIDGWYDSGAMPFAQWGYPQHNAEKFREQFPADFISEAIDQTRGWFYSLLAVSTMMFGQDEGTGETRNAEWGRGNREQGTGNAGNDGGVTSVAQSAVRNPQSAISNQQSPYPLPFRNCIVLGLMLGEDGQKMSKSKRNYREPNEIFEKYGADALRWYFYANQPPWTSIRYKEQAIKDSIPEFLLRLWNCYSFFVIYANIDGFDPTAVMSPAAGGSPLQFSSQDFASARGYRPYAERGELDRWVLSELHRTLAAVVECLDRYDNFEACKHINAFVDGLSNWYVRRSRDRFWAKDKNAPEKLDAYWTLYECLLTTTKMIAPFVPFLAETLWQNLTQSSPHAPHEDKPHTDDLSGSDITRSVMTTQREEATLNALESVHLCDYPLGDHAVVDEQLSSQMQTLREIASLGRSARMDNKLKVRQPLASVQVVLSNTEHQPWLEQHEDLLRDELNVKRIDYTREAEKYITYQVQPNFKRLGPRVGKLLPALKAALAQAHGGALLAELSNVGKVTLSLGNETVELDSEDIQVRLHAKPGWAAAQGSSVVVVLNTELTPELIAEGYARDFVRLVQDRRKEMNLDFTDRIVLAFTTASDVLREAIASNAEFITGETLATLLDTTAQSAVDGQQIEIGDFPATLYVEKTK